MIEEHTEQEAQGKRPTGLWVLFILSTISTGLSFLAALVNLLQGPPNQSVTNQMKAETVSYTHLTLPTKRIV